MEETKKKRVVSSGSISARNIDVGVDTIIKLKVIAVRRGKHLHELIAETLKEYVKTHEDET